jgi:tetratricopeptide (TPR) repeat protein
MMRFLKRSIPFLLAVSLVVGAPQDKLRELEQKLKSNPNDEVVLMELGRSYHDMASAGDKSAIEKGFRCFDRAFSLDTTNVVALAYRGSMWTLRALDSWWPPNKLKFFKQGTDEMDRAVELAPDNMMVRLIRGIDEMDLPEFASRLPTALEDFIVLLRHPDFPEQTRELKALIYFYAGMAHKRADAYDRAGELFKKAIAILPGSEFAKRSQDALNEMGL